MKTTVNKIVIATALVLSLVPATSARSMHRHTHKGMMVAYDAKDKRYYSLAYAKAHGMHDAGGDPLTVRPMSSLPKAAKMSRVMHGHM